jgi:hypothetical protein
MTNNNINSHTGEFCGRFGVMLNCNPAGHEVKILDISKGVA